MVKFEYKKFVRLKIAIFPLFIGNCRDFANKKHEFVSSAKMTLVIEFKNMV